MQTPSNFAELVRELILLISDVIPVIFAITFLVIAWKIIDAWIINAGDEAKVAEGKQTIIIGVLVFVVMSSIWGIVAIIRASVF